MNRCVIALAIICLLVACAGSAYGYAIEYPEGQPVVVQAGWPDGLTELLNSQGRVYGYWCNSTDTLYFSGGTEAFSRFLMAYSRVDLPSHILTVHSERGTAKTLGGEKIGFDWSVAVCTVWSSGPASQPPAVSIDLWAGDVQLSKIKSPKNVDTYGTKPPAFAIYLLADQKLNAFDALKLKLGDLQLQQKPLFTIDDIVSYRWKDHTLTLKPETIGRMPKLMNVYGVPFVVTARGKRIYAGAFWTFLSSAAHPSAPIIYVDPPLRGKNTLRIDLPSAGKVDPRDDPAIKAAFGKAGKLL